MLVLEYWYSNGHVEVFNEVGSVSREDAQELFDYLLEYARKFEEHKETEA
jgi:hypothetical protein